MLPLLVSGGEIAGGRAEAEVAADSSGSIVIEGDGFVGVSPSPTASAGFGSGCGSFMPWIEYSASCGLSSSSGVSVAVVDVASEVKEVVECSCCCCSFCRESVSDGTMDLDALASCRSAMDGMMGG